MAAQPHFEDERTLLKARPVIPLEKIDTKLKHRRVWFLSGAFAAAMLLGAASALVSAYFKIRNAPDPEIQSQSLLSVSPLPVPVVELRPERPAVRPKEKDLNKADQTEIRNLDTRPRLSEDEELRSIRDAVLVDQWQERRQRRVERREERRERRRANRDLSHGSGRDLSNLDEIFEGRRRPY